MEIVYIIGNLKELIVRELYKTVLARLPSMLLIPIAIVPQAPVDLEASFALG